MTPFDGEEHARFAALRRSADCGRIASMRFGVETRRADRASYVDTILSGGALMSIYFASVVQWKKMLSNLDKWIEASIEFAKKKSFDPNTLVSARLAPDQYAFVRQVQSACDSAKFGAARLSGKEAPKHPDTEQTIDELRARIRAATDYLATFKAADFAGAETRAIDLPFLEGKKVLGADYLVEMANANFYFHVTHAYAILRHSGVELGKRDYIGAMTLQG
jgi:hypothetical protein